MHSRTTATQGATHRQHAKRAQRVPARHTPIQKGSRHDHTQPMDTKRAEEPPHIRTTAKKHRNHIQPSRQPPALMRSGGTEARPKPRTEGSRATNRTQGSEQGSRTATEGSTTNQDTTNRAPTRNTDTKNRQTIWQRVNTSERSEDRHNRKTRAEEEQHTHHTNKAATRAAPRHARSESGY